MFKLVKITNASTPIPEAERHLLKRGVEYVRGSIAYLDDGIITYEPMFTANPTKYCILEDVKADSNQKLIACFRVTSDMVFEVEAVQDREEDPLPLDGDKVMMRDGYYVSFEPNGEFTVDSTVGYNVTGKLLGRFERIV